MAEFLEAYPEVISIAQEIIDAHHPDLEDASIGFLMIDKAPKRSGFTVFGYAKKITSEMRQFVDHDYLIVISEDMWITLTQAQKRALIDHELTHCAYDPVEGKAKVRDHDIQEFYSIIKRHGLWWPTADRLSDALQPHLPFTGERPSNGRVAVVDPGLGRVLSVQTALQEQE